MSSSWILLGIVVGCTVMGDLLSSLEMKRHGEVQEFHPRGLARLLATLAVAVGVLNAACLTY